MSTNSQAYARNGFCSRTFYPRKKKNNNNIRNFVHWFWQYRWKFKIDHHRKRKKTTHTYYTPMVAGHIFISLPANFITEANLMYEEKKTLTSWNSVPFSIHSTFFSNVFFSHNHIFFFYLMLSSNNTQFVRYMHTGKILDFHTIFVMDREKNVRQTLIGHWNSTEMRKWHYCCHRCNKIHQISHRQ